jgi:deoxyribonuclease V
MHIADLHPWPETFDEAVAIQNFLTTGVRLQNELPKRIETVAGVDVSYEKHGDRFYAGVVILSFPDFEVIEEQTAVATVTFPYIPGLLSFRELPVLLDAFRQVENIPEVVLVDGQGIAHPRRFGLACHLGLWSDLPTIGCAKSRLCGEHEEPGLKKGSRSDLLLDKERIGQVVRTRDRVKPMYISPGHKIDIETATEIALQGCNRYRLPEPTRLAHHLTNHTRKHNI